MSLTREELIAGSSPESELEAAIWLAMEQHKVTCADALSFHDSLLTAAIAYAARDSDLLTEMRRRVLHGATAKSHSSASSSGGASRTATELHPSGSVASCASDVAGGGATTSTGLSIPGPSASAFTDVIHNPDPDIHRSDRDDKPLEVD